MSIYIGQSPTSAGAIFSLPETSAPIDRLFSKYLAIKADIESVSEMMGSKSFDRTLGYFLDGNCGSSTLVANRISRAMFNREGAIKALDSSFWSQAMALTDVLEVMPQARRQEWGEMIRENKTPAFDRETVISTLTELLNSRESFFAERVDGVFRSLSGDHVTNIPQGFYKRMIIAGVLDQFGFTSIQQCGYLSDLRSLIAKFMGRIEPTYYSTSSLVAMAYESTGQWVTIDGGSLRIKVFKKGTAHIEIHEDLAWRLNAVLASMYPGALPPESRKPSNKPRKTFNLRNSYLDQPVLEALIQIIKRRGVKENTVTLPYESGNTGLTKELSSIMVSIGGSPGRTLSSYVFDYDPLPVLKSIAMAGFIPDHYSHQFYSTSESLAEKAVAQADIKPGMSVLEPSAGIGGIAKFLPSNSTTCVELAPLRCLVLKEMGFKDVVANDFIEWADGARQYDRIVMNPPFSKGRAKEHLLAAERCLADGGKIVAILPGSMINSAPLPGFKHNWSEILEDQFVGTGVRVAILVAEKE